MAAGLPCVAFDIPQHRDLINDRLDGYLCKHHDEMLLRVAALIDSKDLRQTIGQNARQKALERFSHENFKRRLLAAYEIGPSKIPLHAGTSPPAQSNRPVSIVSIETQCQLRDQHAQQV